MKKVLLLLLAVFSSVLWGLEFDYEGDQVHIWGDFEVSDLTELTREGEQYIEVNLADCCQGGLPNKALSNHYTQLLSLPATGNWKVRNFDCDYVEMQLDLPLMANNRETEAELPADNRGWYPSDIISISDPVLMRNFRFSQVSIAGMQYNNSHKIRIVKSVDLWLELDNTVDKNALQNVVAGSNGFNKVAEQTVAGYNGSRTNEKGLYLIICPDIPEVVNILQYLVNWKHKLGFPAQIVTLSETGDTSEEIKNYLQNAYDNWETPPEYVVLAGDVSGNIVVPSWYIAGYLTSYDVTDHSYTLLAGDDYFPDIMLGRFSVQSLSQLQTIVSKIITYESNPPLINDWFTKAIMCSYVLDIGGYYQMYSQRETVMKVREKLLDFTYTAVDTFIAPWQSSPANLADIINNGCTFINYRGAGSPSTWSSGYGSMFSIWDFPLLSNGFMLPMVTSIVCGGGNFADASYASCLGETWLAYGSAQNPAGAIGFIGPSELDTKTPFNNCNDLGIYQGITQEGIFGSAAMMLRGKMELYNNYPDCHDMDGSNDAWDSDQFYFYVYNLLGDPALEVWTDFPQEITADIPAEISSAASQMHIFVENNSAQTFTAAITTEDGLYNSAQSNSAGDIWLEVPADFLNFDVTVSAYGFLPVTQEVAKSQSIEEVTVSSLQFSEPPEVAAEVILNLTLTNTTASSLDSFSVQIDNTDELVEVQNSLQYVSELASGDSTILQFNLAFEDEWRQQPQSSLDLEFAEGELGSFHLDYEINSPQLEYASHSVLNEENSLLPGQENELILNLYNAGDMETGSITAILGSVDGKCQITGGDCQFGNISPQETEMGTCAFQLTPAENLLNGEPLDFNLVIVRDNAAVWESSFSLQAGIINEESATFSSYGYFALESSDLCPDAPVYNWQEIAPAAGGYGDYVPHGHETSDGWSSCITLPFQFCYYGRYYSEATISSNGWLAMGDEEYVFFRNRTIPSGVGPDAMIAPFWDEISDGEIYTWYNEEEHCFIIEWYDFQDVNHSQDINFQVILYDPLYYETPTGDGEIKFQYKDIINNNQNENYATIGIENHNQTQGLLLSFANRYPATMHELVPESAILFSVNEGFPVPQIQTNEEEIVLSLPPDTLITYEVQLHNLSTAAPISYDIDVSHFPQREAGEEGSRDISGDSVNQVNQVYYTGHELNFCGFVVHEEESEPIYGIIMDFPDYINVISATDIAELEYNGQTGPGAEVSWGFGNGNSYSGGTPPVFHVYFIIESGITSPVSFQWQIVGDGSGAEPHTVSGTITLMPSDQTYIWLDYPNGGEEIAYGITDTIRWTSYGDIQQVDLYYSDTYFNDYQTIAESIENTGNLQWNVPDELTATAMIRVRNSNGSEYDDSDEYFSILGLVINHPAEGEIVQYASTSQICWDFTGGAETVKLEISTDNGYQWVVLDDAAPNTGSYNYYVNFPPSDECKIRISNPENTVQYTMPGTFRIIDAPVSWIEVFPAHGVLQPEEISSCQININTGSMSPGHYQAYLNITASNGQKINLPVLLEIENLASDENEIQPVACLKNNYPNPFFCRNGRTGGTNISFSLTEDAYVKLSAYNIKGQQVIVFVDGEMVSGIYDIQWDGLDRNGSSLAAGVYFYRLEIDNRLMATKKCLLLK